MKDKRPGDEQWKEFTRAMTEKGWAAIYDIWWKVAKWRHDNGTVVDNEKAYSRWKHNKSTPPPF